MWGKERCCVGGGGVRGGHTLTHTHVHERTQVRLAFYRINQFFIAVARLAASMGTFWKLQHAPLSFALRSL